MAGPSIGTWVKVKNKSGRMTSRVIPNKFGGGGYSQGEVITQSEFQKVQQQRAEAKQKQSAPKQEVVGFQGDLFGGGQTIITSQIRKEEQRGKNGRGMTPTVKAAIAKSISAQVPDLATKIKNAKPTDSLSESDFALLRDGIKNGGISKPNTKIGNYSEQKKGWDKKDSARRLVKLGLAEELKNGNFRILDAGNQVAKTHKPFGTVEIKVPGAATYRIKNNGYALGKFLKKVGIKPDELSKLSKRV